MIRQRKLGVYTEGVLLCLISPFLLFPRRYFVLTAVSLILLTLLWLLPLLTKHRPIWPNTPFNLAFLILWLTVAIAILVSADPDLTLPKATGLLLGMAWFQYITWAAADRKWLAVAFVFWGMLGIGFTVIGLLNLAWLEKAPGLTWILQALPTRFLQIPGSSVGVQPNQLAGTLLLYFPFLLSLLFGWRRGVYHRFWLPIFGGLTAVTLILLLIIQSRSGWLGAIGGLLTLLLLWALILPPSRKRRVFSLTLPLLLGIGGITLLLIGPDQLQTMWQDPAQLGVTAVGKFTSISFRQEVWRWSIMATQDFPFTGTGLGTFRVVVRRFYPLNVSATYDIAHAHNIFLQTALDIGLPGLVAYLAMLFIAGVISWQIAKQDLTLRPFALGICASIIALHIYGLTDALTLGSKTTLSFWVALGLLAGMWRQTKSSPAKSFI